MEEYSVSFLAKDRNLTYEKRRWIREHVRRRECVQFVDAVSARAGMSYVPLNDTLTHLDSEAGQEGGIQLTADEKEAQFTKMCRCGRQLKEHVELNSDVHRGSRDYRLFSEEFPTDVFLELLHTQRSILWPISYSPKQVIRLAADTELNVLRQLIGPIWHVPKSNFLVSVHGSCGGTRGEGRLLSKLRGLLRVLSNPGSVLLTVSLTDPALYEKVMESCDVNWPRVPFAEVTPVVFLPWSGLTCRERQILRDVTDLGSSVEFEEVKDEISALSNVRQKGYFLLADYGVEADLGSATSSPPLGTTTTTETDAEEDDSVPSPTVQEGYPICITVADLSSASASESRGAGVKGSAAEPGEVNVCPRSSPVLPSEDDDGATAEVADDSDDGAYENVPFRKDGCASGAEEHSSCSERAGSDVQDTDAPEEARRAPSGHATPEEQQTPPLGMRRREEASSAPGMSSVSDERGRNGHVQDYQLFSYSFPHPLRGRMESLLKKHTHDPEGQGSLMILYGSTSFLDLAAAHGAIRSGIPVIFDENGLGATDLLLSVMRDVDKKDDKGTADLISEKRHVVTNDKDLNEAIHEHSTKLKDYTRYKGQMFRVIRDILNSRHLVTVYDFDAGLYHSTPLPTVTVEAFIRARPGEEAVTFIKKNTMRLAAEDNEHPVKKVQRAFQRATIAAAMKQNRPELLDVVVDQGFVSESEVFRNHSHQPFRVQERKNMLAGDSIPFTEIKDLQYFEARECFVQRVCQLENDAGTASAWQSDDDDIPFLTVHQLFLHSVVNGRTELAKHFWKQSVFQDHVVHALVASHVSTYLADRVPGDSQVQVFTRQAEEFATLAKGTLNDCYRTDSKKAAALVMQKAEAFGLSPIEAAVSFGMRSFVALPASSLFLESVWKGQELLQSSESKENPVGCRQKCSKSCTFFTSPRNICFTSTVFYLLFLGLYGHSIIFQSGKGQLSPLDITLMVWVFSFLVEEIIQLMRPRVFLVSRVNSQSSFRTKLAAYFHDTWNILDVLGLFFFILGYVLRVVLPSSEAGHVLLSLVYVLFFLRLLRVLTISRSIGPMLPMIWNMLGDLLPFLVILFVFVLAYGVTSEALLHPGTTWHGLYLLYLPRVAFWPIFGEYGLDTIEGGDCQNDTLWYTEGGAEVLCPSRVGRHLVPVIMGLYILVTNVLMLNLLIAYFNHSFEKVHNESNIWWAWLRCGLIGEYYARHFLPVPFVLVYRVLYVVFWLLRKLVRCLLSCLACCRRRCCLRRHRSPVLYCKRFRSEGEVEFNLYSLGRGNVDEPLTCERSIHVQTAFAEHEDVLDILDLDDFRFSDLGRGADRTDAFFVESAVLPGSNEAATTSMSELQKWEAVQASGQPLLLRSQSPPRANDRAPAAEPRTLTATGGKSQSKQDDLEDLMLRLEKKIEDNREHLRALMHKLTMDSEGSPESEGATRRTSTTAVEVGEKIDDA